MDDEECYKADRYQGPDSQDGIDQCLGALRFVSNRVEDESKIALDKFVIIEQTLEWIYA